ncbi:phosphatidylinositol-4-phosphate 5-kinase-like protein 1 [Phytophthora boehmeriae]|uniref:Phosphatidylinositol-4-phosphate 5-kinase-like protein 1 n=1 Tax=Phytophthora boehmeriae TaxID=109152 RepID=A0A8T1WV14_9STRA|nr:phosphatidylinositol-4-phosphate 5-kinase-like protein 1 [Phytophthora boehmeriae]
MPASRRALPSSGPSTPTLPLRSFDGASSTSPSPQQYQAVLTPTRSSQELEFALIGRSLSHSHALSVILGASGRASSPTATVDWRPSTHHVQSQTSPLNQAQARTQEDTHNQDRKSELPLRLARWRRRRRRWRKSLFWVATGCVFAGCFALSFLAPWEFHTLAPIALGSGLSFVATLMVLLSFLTSRRFRRRPNELFAFVALSELGLATLSLVHILTMCSAKDGVCRPMGLASCSVATGLEMFLLLAGVGWFGAAILHLFVSVSNPFASYKRQLVLSHFLVWGISLLASVVTPIALFASRTQEKFQLSAAQICRNVALVLPLLPPDAIGSVSVSRAERLEQWQQLNLEFWGILVVIVVLVVVAAQFSLVVGWWRSNSGTVIALKARRRLMKRMAIYVHALNATWLVLLVLFFVYRSSANALSYVPAEGAPQPSDGRMDFLDALFHFVLTGKGFITGV